MSKVERSVAPLPSKGKPIVRFLILGFPVMFLLLLTTTVACYYKFVPHQTLFSVICSYAIYRIIVPIIIRFTTVDEGQVSPDRLDGTIVRPPPLKDE